MPDPSGVTAVLVSHDGASWLPEALAALAAQTVAPDQVVAVDTGSQDLGPAMVRDALGDLLLLPRTTGYGAAVAAALDTVPPTPWVWLLHDDLAPAPDALERLLEHARSSPSAALLGPKVRDWDDPRRLVEVGLTSDRAGRRLTGLDRHELDQGQRDAVRDVLAVGTAGALVRREVWDAVGGLDPALPLRADDLDLGRRVNAAGHRVVVVPAATARHARALTTGRRAADAAPGRATAVERRHALLVALAHAPAPALLLTVPGLLLASLLRALLLLAGRRPQRAWDELAAPYAVLARPGRLRAARRSRAATRAVPASSVRPLLARRTDPLRARADALAERLAGPGRAARDASWPARLRRRPGLLLVLGLAVLALLAERSLLGRGALQGGRLLPAPPGASDLWESWAAPGGEPATAVLAALATVLLGRAPTAVGVLLLASVPLAGAVAYAAAGRVVRSPLLRGWAAATWALLPVATGAVAAGRLDAAAVQVALPALLVGAWSLLSRDPRTAGWHRPWALGLALAAVTALAPLLWLPAAVALAGGALAALRAATPADRPAARRRAVACGVALAVPVLLLLPWTWLDGAALLHGPGRLGPGLADPDLPAWHLLLLQPGGPGTPALLLTAGLLLGALLGLLRTGRPRLAAAGWGLVLLGLAVALVQARVDAGGRPGWPGTGLQLAAAGTVVTVLAAAEGLTGRLARSAFGWRQLLAVAAVAATAAVPVLCGLSWLVRGADGPLQRGGTAALPAFVRSDLAATGSRALVLRPRADGTVAYAVTGPLGVRLGEQPYADDRLDDAVADLLAPSGSDAAAALATRGVRWVATDATGLAPALDAQDGLARQVGTAPALWRVLPTSARLRLLPPDAARAALSGRRTAAGADPVEDRVPAGPAGRLLVLTEPAGGPWHAELAGRRLPERTAHGWAQAFALPPQGGPVEVVRDGTGPRRLLQGLLLLAVAVLAVPARPEEQR